VALSNLTGPVVVIDGGDLFGDMPVLPENMRAQVEIKARAQVRSYAAHGWDVFVPGEADFAIGTSVFLELMAGVEVAVLAGNLRCDDRSFDGGVVVERGGYRVGVVGVVSGSYGECEVGDPVVSAIASRTALGDVDVTVAVVHGPSEVASGVAEAISPDFLLNGHTSSSTENPTNSDWGWSIGAGNKGKRLGLLELSWREGAEGWAWAGGSSRIASQLDRYRERLDSANSALASATEVDQGRLQNRVDYYQQQVGTLEAQLGTLLGDGEAENSFSHTLLEMGESIGEDPATLELIAATKLSIEQSAMEDSVDSRSSALPFVGSAVCRGCHTDQWEQWNATDHSGAWDTLVEVSRQSDLACFECHVTGAHHPEGPTHPNNVGVLTGVGCESCHGPRASHLSAAASGTLGETAGEPQVTLDVCVQCHDGDRDDGDFDAPTYMEAVRH
jgi:hypothetical protein